MGTTCAFIRSSCAWQFSSDFFFFFLQKIENIESEAEMIVSQGSPLDQQFSEVRIYDHVRLQNSFLMYHMGKFMLIAYILASR